MAVTDDFSFPTLLATTSDSKNDDNNKNDSKSSANSNQTSHFALSSPSLWRISSMVYPDDEILDEQEMNDTQGIVVSKVNVDDAMMTMKSFSDTEADRDSEERMDSLWEDFNENDRVVTVRPLQRVSSLDNRDSNSKRKMIGSSRYINYYPSRSDDIVFDVYDRHRRYHNNQDQDQDQDRCCIDRTAGNSGSEVGDGQVLKMVMMKSGDYMGNNDCSSNISVRTNLTRHRKRNSMAVLLRAFRKIFMLQNLSRNNKMK